MKMHADKQQESKNQAVANNLTEQQSGNNSSFQLVDNSKQAIMQRKLQETINKNSRVKQLNAYQEMADNGRYVKQLKAYQVVADSYASQNALRQEILDEQPLQGKFEDQQKKENNTGLPDQLKSGVEKLSGFSMDDVKVHYNSDKPAPLQAHAYAQGAEIHLASGQEKHLAHEAWHVVQQKQGRVKPTMQMKDNIHVNDDPGLEKEASVMGAQAMQFYATSPTEVSSNSNSSSSHLVNSTSNNEPIQRVLIVNDVNISRELIVGQQEGFKNSCKPHLAKAGFPDITVEQWRLVFDGMDAVAADPRVFKFTQTDHLMLKILQGQNIETIASVHVQQEDELEHIEGLTTLEPRGKVKQKEDEISKSRKEKASKKEDSIHKVKLHEDVYSGTFECGPDRNWADLHVVGETGGSADPGPLMQYFTTVYKLMNGHFKFSQVPGVLEWHPTGAVVTKQIVELLGESVGSWGEWMKAKYEQESRRREDNRSNREYNKLAGKISPAFVPEHMHFLKSLKNAKGVSVRAKGLPVPPEVMEFLRSKKSDHLTAEQVEELMSPDMTADSPEGNATLLSYEQALTDPDRGEGPSLIIKLDFRQLPKLIEKLAKTPKKKPK